jgi:hypothetical protein
MRSLKSLRHIRIFSDHGGDPRERRRCSSRMKSVVLEFWVSAPRAIFFEASKMRLGTGDTRYNSRFEISRTVDGT